MGLMILRFLRHLRRGKSQANQRSGSTFRKHATPNGEMNIEEYIYFSAKLDFRLEREPTSVVRSPKAT